MKISRRIKIGGTLNRAQIIRCIALAWLLLVVVGSLQSARPRPVVSHHREIHWLAFGGIAFLLLLLSRNRRQEIRGVVATCLLGLSLENLQHIIYRSPMEWYDVRVDALAALVAFALVRLAVICKAALPTPAIPVSGKCGVSARHGAPLKSEPRAPVSGKILQSLTKRV